MEACLLEQGFTIEPPLDQMAISEVFLSGDAHGTAILTDCLRAVYESHFTNGFGVMVTGP